MEAIEKSMDSKEKDGAKARENAAYVQTIIEQIEKISKQLRMVLTSLIHQYAQ